MKHPLFSIVVPIYKVEMYLRTCVDSILNQSFADYEIILVDDGSPDKCPSICDEYAGKDERIMVVHKENGGLSDARNAGIAKASGEYLIFVDADDYIAAETLARISRVIIEDGKADVVFLGALCVYPSGETAPYGKGFERERLYRKGKKDVIRYLNSIPQFHVSACLKLVDRRLIAGNNLLFTKGLLGEDVDWSIKLYLAAETFNCAKHTHYYYRQGRDGSIMNAFSEKRYGDLIDIVMKWIALSESEYMDYSDDIRRFMYHQYYMLVLMYRNIRLKNRKKYKPLLKKLSWLMKCTDNNNIWLVILFYRLFGLRLLSSAMNFYLGVAGSNE